MRGFKKFITPLLAVILALTPPHIHLLQLKAHLS